MIIILHQYINMFNKYRIHVQADLATAGMGEGPPASDFQSATPLVRATCCGLLA